MSSLTERVVIVTGAAGNLGRAVVNAFGALSAHLVLVDRAPDRLEQLYPEFAASADHYLATSVDLTDVDSVQAMVDNVVARYGRIDVLANCVGGYRAGKPVHETPIETWEFMLALNARTAFVVSRAVAPVMLNQGHGKIVHVASRAGLSGGAGMAAYSASKAAVIRLTESLSADLKRHGINVNCVVPGTLDTPQNRQAMPKARYSRWVTPEAVADVIVFLASHAGRAIHGAAIPVYGTA